METRYFSMWQKSRTVDFPHDHYAFPAITSLWGTETRRRLQMRIVFVALISCLSMAACSLQSPTSDAQSNLPSLQLVVSNPKPEIDLEAAA
jgi:hypothetical protein